MQIQTEVALEEAEFYAFHGYYEEERRLGGRYTVSIRATLPPVEAAKDDELQHTLNYEALYQIAKRTMEKPRKLLEPLCQEMLDAVFSQFPEVQHVEVSVRKLRPPLGGPCVATRVTLSASKET